jgi:UDP-glucose 4-epimerase
MRYLVTGGAGFIGSHLVDSLVKQGHGVKVLDDLSTGNPANVHSAAQLVVGSISDTAVLRKCLTDVDGCFHLAAIASVQMSVEKWGQTHRVNQTGLVDLFEIISRSRSPRIPVVYASSAAVFGANSSIPLNESSACKPINAYGVDKLACEWHAYVATQLHNIPSVGLRFFNVYGPRQDPKSPYSGVISLFANAMVEGSPLTIFGDGQQSRDFVFVADVVCALQASMQLASANPINRVYCVCTGRGTSVLELAEHLGKIVGRPPQITFAPARRGDIAHSVGNNGALRGDTGFSPQTPLPVGLEHTVLALRSE